MDAQLAQDKVKAALKQLLKKQNHTYEAVAKVWDCSVPTVKRQLGPEELPLSRLLVLLEWLNLSLADLQKLVDSGAGGNPKFTAKQNEFLAKNPREFSFFMKLWEDMTPEQIAKKYSLSRETLEKILIQLEKHDLVRVGAGGKVKPAFDQVPSIEGPLGQAHVRRIIDRMAQFQKNHLSEILERQTRGLEVEHGSLSWHCGDMTKKTFEVFRKKFQDLVAEMGELSKIEDKVNKKSDLKMAVATAGCFLCEPGDKNLHLVTEYFDEGLASAD